MRKINILFALIATVLLGITSCGSEENDPQPNAPILVDNSGVGDFKISDLNGFWDYQSVEYNGVTYTECKSSELFNSIVDENKTNLKLTGMTISFNTTNSTGKFVDCDGTNAYGGDFVKINFDFDNLEFTTIDESNEESIKFKINDYDFTTTPKTIQVEIVKDYKGDLIDGTNVVEGLIFTLVK